LISKEIIFVHNVQALRTFFGSATAAQLAKSLGFLRKKKCSEGARF
jgi:hypothetical protein